MAFKDRVEAITKLTIDTGQPVTQNQLDELLTEGRREVTNAMPMSIKMSRHGHTVSSFTSTAVGSESANHESGEVLWVTRNDGTIDQPCRKISRRLAARATDSSEMFAATVNDPVWYTNGNQVNALPASGSCKYAVLQFNTVSNSDSAITEFPDDYEYLVVLYAAIKSLQAAMADKSSSLPEDISLPAIPTLTGIATVSYTNASNEDALVDVITVPAKIDVSSNAPNFNKPSVATSIGQATTALENEDIELMGSAVQKIQSELATVNANFANEQAEFNKESSIYQMEFQEEVTRVNQELQAEIEKFRARLSVSQSNKQQDQALNIQNAIKQMEAIISDNSNKLQKFGADLQRYQALVSAEVQNFNLKLQKQTTDYQWFVSQRQQLQADYDKGIQIMRGT